MASHVIGQLMTLERIPTDEELRLAHVNPLLTLDMFDPLYRETVPARSPRMQVVRPIAVRTRRERQPTPLIPRRHG